MQLAFPEVSLVAGESMFNGQSGLGGRDSLQTPNDQLLVQLRLMTQRKFTENVFIGILFPCGSASFAKDRSYLFQRMPAQKLELLLVS